MNASPRQTHLNRSRSAAPWAARVRRALWLPLALALLLAAAPGQGAIPNTDGGAPAHWLADGGPSHQALPADPGPTAPRRHHHDDDQDPPPALPVAAAGPLPPTLSPAPSATRATALPGRRRHSPGAPRAPPL